MTGGFCYTELIPGNGPIFIFRDKENVYGNHKTDGQTVLY